MDVFYRISRSKCSFVKKSSWHIVNFVIEYFQIGDSVVEVHFSGMPRAGLIQTVQPYRNVMQSNLMAQRSSVEADAFVRRRPAAAALAHEHAMTVRPAVFDYHAAKFSPRDAQTFMATRLL
jgi:hypothetical protein